MNFVFSVEQVKGSDETREKILKASREARLRSDYPSELQAELFNNSICDQYYNFQPQHHIRANGI